MEALIKSAEQILYKNWRDGFTVPSSKLYPFQWNWDSSIVSVGMSHKRLDYAMAEIKSLFSGQWNNGMLPHIIFHSEKEDSYFPNFDFWHSTLNPEAPETPKSSGITQPAVHGFILERLLELHPDSEELVNFAKTMFPKIVKYHKYLYERRDPNSEGLMFIYHPWESGRDNSPLWDPSLERIEIKENGVSSYERKDITLADPSERPTSFQYDRYVYLIELGKRNKFQCKGIANESPFLIQDTLMNAILIKSNQSLINIGNRFQFDVGEILEWQSQSIKSYSEKFWNDELKTFTPYDMIDKKHIAYKEIGGLTPIFAGIASKEQAAVINNYLLSLHDRGFYICPSFDVDNPHFDSKRYWRGPVWPHMNWMLYSGLKDYGYEGTAKIVKSDVIELVSQCGFWEYFEAQKSLAKNLTNGYGGSDFSWTASCLIDLIKQE